MLLTKLKTGTAVLLVLATVVLAGSVVVGGQTGNKGVAQERAKQVAKLVATPKDADASAQLPPDIKEGVRIAFGTNSRTQWRFADEKQSPLVARVRGNWVFLKGIEPEGYGLEGLEGCWLNFNTVDWYVIVPK